MVVNRVIPNAPILTADRAPAGSKWYRDAVQVSFADGGDAALPDGSPGSGLNPTSLPAPQLITATGTTTVSGSVRDRAGNTSPTVSRSYRVDAAAPVASATVTAGGTPYTEGSWTAADVRVTFACWMRARASPPRRRRWS